MQPPANVIPKRRARTDSKGNDIVARIRTIIDRYEEGNVSAAARRLGVSQRGLAKCYKGGKGGTRDPRVSLVAAIVRTYPRVDVRWLITGRAETSSGAVDAQASMRAAELLEQHAVKLRAMAMVRAARLARARAEHRTAAKRARSPRQRRRAS